MVGGCREDSPWEFHFHFCLTLFPSSSRGLGCGGEETSGPSTQSSQPQAMKACSCSAQGCSSVFPGWLGESGRRGAC